MNKQRKDEIQILVQKILDGEISVGDAIRQWPPGKLINHSEETLIHELQHYDADDDIRMKDLKYAQYQKETVEKLLQQVLDS